LRHGSRATASTAETPTLIFRRGKPVLNQNKKFNKEKDKNYEFARSTKSTTAAVD